MDPLDITSFNHCYADLSTSLGNRKYHFVDQKPENFNSKTTHTLLLLHGFPDLFYGWRYQIGPLTRAGYRVVAPDCLGYGGSDKPAGIENYTPKAISEDMRALLDYLNIERVVVVGHDWGAAIAWRFCAFYPDRVEAIVAASVPFNPPATRYLPQHEVTQRAANLGYMEYLEEPNNVPEIQSKLYRMINTLFRSSKASEVEKVEIFQVGNLQKILKGEIVLTSGRTDLMEAEELEVYLRAFTPNKDGGGIAGPLSYYQTGKLRIEQERHLPSALPPSLPVLFLHPTLDVVCVPQQVDRMSKFVPALTVVPFPCGHWIQVEKRDEVNECILRWLSNTLYDGSSGTAKL